MLRLGRNVYGVISGMLGVIFPSLRQMSASFPLDGHFSSNTVGICTGLL
jgi:hypothetical protein